jgi:hypothetical protein
LEFLKQNFYDTTTQIIVNSNTISSEYLMSPDLTLQCVSSGLNDDTQIFQVRIQFDQTMTVDRIALMGHNVKEYVGYYNGVTANAFALVAGQTTTMHFTGNADTLQYMPVTPVACTSVSFDFKKTMTVNAEKAIGYLAVSELIYAFERNPAAPDFTPVINPMQLVHQLSTGGTRSHTIDNKWSHKIKFSNITQTFRDSLKAVYDLQTPVLFVPFGTTTAWDGVLYEANWTGPFQFYQYSDSAVAAGYTGQIQLLET